MMFFVASDTFLPRLSLPRGFPLKNLTDSSFKEYIATALVHAVLFCLLSPHGHSLSTWSPQLHSRLELRVLLVDNPLQNTEPLSQVTISESTPHSIHQVGLTTVLLVHTCTFDDICLCHHTAFSVPYHFPTVLYYFFHPCCCIFTLVPRTYFDSPFLIDGLINSISSNKYFKSFVKMCYSVFFVSSIRHSSL